MTILNFMSASNAVGPVAMSAQTIAVTSESDVTMAAIICSTVAVCVAFVSICLTISCVNKKNSTRADARKQEAERDEQSKAARQERTTLYDAAWRTIEHYWKAASCNGEGESIANDSPLKEAWEYVRFCWKENMTREEKARPDNPANTL